MTKDTEKQIGKRPGWFRRLGMGLRRTSRRLVDGISGVFTGRKPLNVATLQEIEDALIAADLGPQLAARLVAELERYKFNKDVDSIEVRSFLADQITKILEPLAQPLPELKSGINCWLVVGVNGSGKTTTIGKLAAQLRGDKKKVFIAAGDTFRAAAIEQLTIWGERAQVPVIKPAGSNADAAGFAFEALTKAKAQERDILLIDTAGRLHNKADLMAELQKIVRVLKKVEPQAPHQTLLVLDATIGQNAINQVETFQQIIPLTGLIVTKLDGSAKGGVVVALAEKFHLPIYAVGVGEAIEDLQPFSAQDFASALMGLDEAADT